jgi:hypothetical protein
MGMTLTYRLTMKEEFALLRKLEKQEGRKLGKREFADWCERFERSHSPEERKAFLEKP